MKARINKYTALLLLILLLLAAAMPAYALFTSEHVISGTVSSDPSLGKYTYVLLKGLTPYVFMPTGAGSDTPEDFTNAYGILSTYGQKYGMVAACNAGIFYATDTERCYCFRYKEADGPVICNGVVLKSAETVDHTDCALFVVDEYGMAGYAPYDADADALAAGTGTWFDIYGREITDRKIVSAVTGFIPIVIGGKSLYDKKDVKLHGFSNYATHYVNRAIRQVIGIKANGDTLLLSPDKDGWTLALAAKAALHSGCVFAYNLDGGGSTQTAIVTDQEAGTIEIVTGKSVNARTVPTFIVFTRDNVPPVSAEPESLQVSGDGTVSVSYRNADGKTSVRTLISNANAEADPPIHEILGGSDKLAGATVLKGSQSRPGVLIYEKTDADRDACLVANGATRKDGRYYDFSTGYSAEITEEGTLYRYKTGSKVLTYLLKTE